MFSACGLSDLGLVRATNEDAFLIDLELGLFCVADGMGGHNAGEVASRLALEVIHDFLRRTRSATDDNWPFGVDRRLSRDGNRLVTAVRLANRQVFSDAEAHEEYSGMGTTVVAAFASESQMAYVGVGDSRIYSFADGHLVQLTQDDSWVAQMVNQDPGVTAASLASHPLRHVLTNVVGACDEVVVNVIEREWAVNEVLLFSTDGLHGLVDDSMIRDILQSHNSLETAARRLIQEALEHGGTDNATALLVRRDD
jgi:serine/threonine protein phosphatase PrpC